MTALTTLGSSPVIPDQSTMANLENQSRPSTKTTVIPNAFASHSPSTSRSTAERENYEPTDGSGSVKGEVTKSTVRESEDTYVEERRDFQRRWREEREREQRSTKVTVSVEHDEDEAA